MAIEFIYFDCMETLVHMDIPSIDVYARWAYRGAEALGLWESEAAFEADWVRHRESLRLGEDPHREGTIRGRLRDMLLERLQGRREGWSRERLEFEAGRIFRGFWEEYRQASFVLPDTRPFLELLQKFLAMPLGVVSNFMVRGGIPELLKLHGLDDLFQVVLVSCDLGRRKPAPSIYQAAIRAAGFHPEEILWVGDSPEADHRGPRESGIRSVLLDPKRLHLDVPERIESLPELAKWVE